MKSKIQIKEVVVGMRGKSNSKIKKVVQEFFLRPPIRVASPVGETSEKTEKNPKFRIVKKIYHGGLPGSGRRA